MEIETMGDQEILPDQPPKLGLKLPLDHEFPLQSKQIVVPRPKQMFEMMPLSARYLKYYVGRRMQKRKPIMDYVNMISAQRMYGCPIGGIGGGTIGRGYKGEFCRFQIYPGLYEYITVPECQFIVNIRDAKNETIFQSVLSTYSKPKKAPPTWEWNLDASKCEYTALYPRAWTTYDLSKYGIQLVCRQISPMIPHNYKDSSLPCAVFVFTAQNVCNEHRDVSITFTWTEVLGGPNKKKRLPKLDLERYSQETTCGITLEQKIANTPCTFTIAKKKCDNETIHQGYCLWNSMKTSAYVWECLNKHGKLRPDPKLSPPPPPLPGQKIKETEKKKGKQKKYKIYKCDSIGLSSAISLDPGGSATTEFCLVWDMPIIKYKKDKKIHRRYYTKYFGSDGTAGAGIAAYALKNYKNWEKQIEEWQDPIFSSSHMPDWFKSALVNELYFVADGGTIWYDVSDEYPEADPRFDKPQILAKEHQYIPRMIREAIEIKKHPNFNREDGWVLPPAWDPIINKIKPKHIQTAKQDTISSFCIDRAKNKNRKMHEFGVFGYLEGHEYRMYNTYDVHFYASFALAQLWPNLQVVLQYMFRDSIAKETVKCRRSLYDGKTVKFKIKDSIPHDLGDPEDAPFTNINAYNIHDVSEWRDLNLKFVLQVARDHRLLRSHCAPFGDERCRTIAYIDDVREGDEDDLYSRATEQAETAVRVEVKPPVEPKAPRNILDLLYSGITSDDDDWSEPPPDEGSGGATWDARTYLTDMYPACVALVRKAIKWDLDGDGLIENGGFPDQTYDAWVMSGPSAYCGGLWVASLSAVSSMARTLGLEEDENEFSKLLERARKAYEEKLWSGAFYRFDTRPCNHNVVMADQLAGHWYLRASGCSEAVFPEANVKKALRTIYDNNVTRFCNGRMGAVNGYVTGARGRIDTAAIQSEEVWTGVTYGLAAIMIYEGMHEQAFATAGGLYNTMTKMGLSFETPEALYENGNHRSIGYMRPLAIWAMYQAIVARPPEPTATLANGQPRFAKDNNHL